MEERDVHFDQMIAGRMDGRVGSSCVGDHERADRMAGGDIENAGLLVRREQVTKEVGEHS